MTAVKPVVVFLGPSLPRHEAAEILDADYRAPARMGDIHCVMAFGVKTIILIDGLFNGVPSIWHREILDALCEGIRVLGASSMGALRAAELHRFGMEGYGTVFEWYRDGLLDSDDEVALIHGPEETGFHPLSEPLVNIRATLSQALEAGCINSDQAHQVIQYARQLYYPERSYGRLLASPVVKEWSEEQRCALTRYIDQKRVDIKRLDAVGVLKYCSESNGMPKVERDGRPQRPVYMQWELGPTLRATLHGRRGSIAGVHVLEEVQKDSARVSAMWAKLSRQFFILRWAEQNEVSCPPDYLNSYSQHWKEQHGVDDEGSWLRANGLMFETYKRLLEERALIQWISDQNPMEFGVECSLERQTRDSRARSYVLAWLQQNGIVPPADVEGPLANDGGVNSQENLDARVRVDERLDAHEVVTWAEKQGPLYFGLPWSFEVAWLRELQITGRAAEIAEMIIDEGG
ncbi:MAG: TfuA-related McrA-glycine thioamidation protein [Anaerolineales bacterium]|nr:TfuA-related McrA-glycine thioamidation protein [Anaerolineales bacterium]